MTIREGPLTYYVLRHRKDEGYCKLSSYGPVPLEEAAYFSVPSAHSFSSSILRYYRWEKRKGSLLPQNKLLTHRALKEGLAISGVTPHPHVLEVIRTRLIERAGVSSLFVSPKKSDGV